jgi:hypothetical protein
MSGDDESPGGSSDAAGGSSNLMVGPNYRSQVHLPDRRLRTSSVWFFLDPPIHIAHLAKSRLVSVRRFELINQPINQNIYARSHDLCSLLLVPGWLCIYPAPRYKALLSRAPSD